ncbi:MAG: hypothetical protein COA67_04685 [Lutibacter sp.]|nr:MAG: hypothetical protein COA67_04685 [Lutibacter sp.]
MKTSTLLLIAFFSTTIFAQKKSIAITSFETSASIPSEYKKAIQNKVIEAFNFTNRYNIVDRTNYEKIIAEKELQKSEDFIDGKTVEQNNFEGAEQIVTGAISQVNIVKKYTETSYYYDCSISFSLQVIDVSSGQILASEIIKPKQSFMGGVLSSSLGGSSTPDKAFHNSLKGTQKAINKFVGKHFPVITLIIEISEVSGNKAKKLLLNTGNSQGAKKNQKFKVLELVNMTVGDKQIIRKKVIGEIKITKVEGEEISEAKVTKGGDAILSKFNANAKIECLSKI